MVREISLRFLGTSSQTNPTRNYSSLLLKLDHQTVMVDCGEGTQRQLQNQYIGGDEKLSSIRHIFITHLHQDHVLGIVPVLCTMMGPSGAAFDANADRQTRVEIYGPLGLRALIRTTLTLCYTNLHGLYTVHELLWPEQSAYLNDPIVSQDAGIVTASLPESDDALLGANSGPRRVIPYVPPLESERPGKDFRLDVASASWPSIATINGVSVSAAPILHRCPAVGYVFEEPASCSTGITDEMVRAVDANSEALRNLRGIAHPRTLLGKVVRDRQTIHLPDGTALHPPPIDIEGRKIVILGDTYDATAGLSKGESDYSRGMTSLAKDADVLVHECTNVALPAPLLYGKKLEDERVEEVRAKAVMRGHSVPQTAGNFAGRMAVRQLLLNHFSIKYPAPHPHFQPDKGASMQPRSEKERKYMAMREIEQQATHAWHLAQNGSSDMQTPSALRKSAIATYDGFVYHVPPRSKTDDGSNGEKRDTARKGRVSGDEYSRLDRSHSSSYSSSTDKSQRHAGRSRGRGRGRERGSNHTSA